MAAKPPTEIRDIGLVARLVRTLIGLAFLAVALGAFILPEIIVLRALFTDLGLRSARIPDSAIEMHRRLSPKYADYARSRIALGIADELGLDEIAATEWPLFGSVFYLRATEAIDDWWKKERLEGDPPSVYAREAIDAAAALVMDPGHAAWVKRHWGEDDYLTRENCFYRMLLINAMTAHHRLTGDAKYLAPLRAQVEGLAREIDASPLGLIDDYPGQCYPTDVAAAIAAIRRADAVLGTDHASFCRRAFRAFTGSLAEPHGLPPFRADSETGTRGDDSRGCSNAWFCIEAPAVWPDQAADWYNAFVTHFWAGDMFAAGFHEFPRGHTSNSWYFDVDAGPVIGGYGSAASAFGLAAARVNNRFEHAFPLAAELVAASWPLPDGTLLLPRALSWLGTPHAPYLGECAVLFQLTRLPYDGAPASGGSRLPLAVFGILTLYFLGAVLFLRIAVRLFRRPRVRVRHAPDY